MRCVSASNAVLQRTFLGAPVRYLPSSRARSANILCGIDFLTILSVSVRTETAVTSEPVPQVVGIATIGRVTLSPSGL